MSSTTQVPLNQEQQPQRAGTSFVRSALEWAETIVMAVVLVAVVFTFLARIITVDGRSMEPTYHNGDRVLVTKLAGAPQQGDVVVDGEVLPGSTFGIEDSITFLPDLPGQVLEFPQTVPEGCVFVLGDNRGNSTDSRFVSVGMVDLRNILGKAVFQLYPFSQAGFDS